ncbi:hypothetical protein [Streptomyces sp. 4N124]|uniref:hypothetical protein n=1 Tax=Streptomyces sp. 4N124 TaxID=3457420 RepID=UPI003FD5D542
MAMDNQVVGFVKDSDDAAVDGTNAHAPGGPGVWGEGVPGVLGTARPSTREIGVYGISEFGPGVKGESRVSNAALTEDVSFGVWGKSWGTREEGDAAGVKGEAARAPGVWGKSTTNPGVLGESRDAAGGDFTGPTGVVCTGGGSGRRGPGIRASSEEGCGGEFESPMHAQVRLVPNEVEFVPGEAGPNPKLPRFGRPGELIAVTDAEGTCSLWLCVSRLDFTLTAAWAPVQLGATIWGQA